MGNKFVIVGGVAGGATAAARLRRLDESAEIILIEKGEFVSYANCGLPYYIGGIIKEKSSLLVQSVDEIRQKYKLDIRTKHEVIAVNQVEGQVSVKNLETGETYTETFDKLLLSPGARPFIPPLPGLESAQNLFTLRTINDAERIVKFLEEQIPQNASSQKRSAVVIGGGFIGLEVAENLHHRGLAVSVVEMADQVIAPQDVEMAAILHNHLRDKGVNLYLSNGVKALGDAGRTVELQQGERLQADIVILAVGLQPDTKFLSDSGIELNEKGYILINEHFQTTRPNIYAVGDAIQVNDYINQSPVNILLAGPANRQARMAADSMIGGEYANDSSYPGTLGTSVFRLFDLTVASTGSNERVLKRHNKNYSVLHIHPHAHAGYYPDAGNLTMKLTFSPEDGRIFGAQIIGTEGVDKRIDVISTAIRGGIPAHDLWKVELAYSPPYSTAKDAVNMIGYLADDLRRGLVETVQWHEIPNLVHEPSVQIIDVRDPYEIPMGSIPGSINIPLGSLRESLAQLSREKTYIVYCQVGLRGYVAARILSQSGFKVKNLDGGYKTYANVYDHKPESRNGSQSELSESGKIVINQPQSATASATLSQSTSIDAVGLQCPGPIQKLYSALKAANPGDLVEIVASDPGFKSDVQHWCANTGNTLVSQEEIPGLHPLYKATIAKGHEEMGTAPAQDNTGEGFQKLETAKKMTLIVFDGDLDKAIAAFILANGASSFGKEVTMFFTFWGLNILRANKNIPVRKPFLEKMFGWMMPRGASNLPLSKMNMLGFGPQMIKFMMKQKNVDSIDTMLAQAQQAGVKLVACTMSMDIMGITAAELIPGVELGGVATYLSEANKGNINLFV